MKQFKLVVKSICSVLLLWVLFTGPAVAQTITQIIDASGDGAGNELQKPEGIAVDDRGAIWLVDDPAMPEAFRASCLIRIARVAPTLDGE